MRALPTRVRQCAAVHSSRRWAWPVAIAVSFLACPMARTAPGQPIFRGDWESGTIASWKNVEVADDRPQSESFQLVTNPVRQGRYAAKFIVRHGYSPFGWNESSMVSWNSRESEGDDYYYAWSTMFPKTWRAPAGWGYILQWHSSGDTAALAFNARANRLELSVHSGHVDDQGDWQYTRNLVLLRTLSPGRWNDFVFHVHWSASNSGAVQVWHRLAGQADFKKVADLSGLPTLLRSDSGTLGIYTLMGMYRMSYCAVPAQLGCTSPRGVQAPTVIYHDGFVRATSFARAATVAFAPRRKPPAWPSGLGRPSVGTASAAGGADFVDATGPYTVASQVSVSALMGYVRGGSSRSSFRGVVYADDGGRPGTLAGVTREATVAAGAGPSWVRLAFRSALRLAPGKYWLGYWYGSTGAFQYFDHIPGAERYAAAPYASEGEPAAQWSSTGTSSAAFSLYAVYSKGP